MGTHDLEAMAEFAEWFYQEKLPEVVR